MTERGLLSLAEEVLGWPSREDIFQPKGGAKRVLADSADRKIGGSLRRLIGGDGARVGILAPNPGRDVTDPPLALVCEFSRRASDSVILEAQRLAWNFSLSPLLITVEPHLIRSFTCCEQNRDEKDPSNYEVHASLSEKQFSLSEQAARALHWVDLITGEFFRKNERRFRRQERADQLLLNNLKYVRNRLLEGNPEEGNPPLDEDLCHDLLARVIFIQFLMDRRDSKDRCALDSTRLEELCGRPRLWEVLRDRDCAYDLFRLLNRRFNGDLFAGDDKDTSSAEQNLLREKEQVDQSHLNLLAELVQGDLVMERSQLCLWRQYSFDVIPLEFISSIYEAFVTKRKKTEGIYYTPQQIVDFVLDGVLPWDGTAWDLKIMDPSCGSGVFLVKAFQRLVYRWVSHTGKKPSPAILRQILERNIFGVDNNRHAVRVASFSLYLAMCEQIEPVSLWEQTSFPKLRGERIIWSDFFDEGISGFRTSEDAESYDIVLGNAPWGKGTIAKSQSAREWAAKHSWRISQKNIGPVFLPKSAALTKRSGTVSMLQPAKALLFNRGDPAQKFRKKFFETFKIEEVTNLAAVRFEHFEESDSPACIVTFRNTAPTREPLTYICPKPGNADHDEGLIIIDPQDVNVIYPREGSTEPEVWTALMWGGRRDWDLLRRLSDNTKYRRLGTFKCVTSSAGIIRGGCAVEHNEIMNRRILEDYGQIRECFLEIEARSLRQNKDVRTHRKTNLEAFSPPQLILKRSWLAGENRFRAFLVRPDEHRQGALVPDTYISVHTQKEDIEKLHAACLAYNSILSVYYLCLLSGQFAAERPKVSVDDCLSVPMPDIRPGLLDGLLDLNDVDHRIRREFDFSDVEWALIEDMRKFTVPYFKSSVSYPDNRTKREKTGESELERYAEYFLRVLRAGFGEEKRLTCVAFVESESQCELPVRLLAVYLDSPFEATYDTEEINSGELYARLNRLYGAFVDRQSSSAAGIFFHRIARIYDVTERAGENVPTVYIIKPDQVRYWTRSMALRDADEVAADIMSWGQSSSFSVSRKGNGFDSTAHLV